MNKKLLSDLMYLDAVASHESFSAAAEGLDITQGAVSQRIKQLEARLGYPVLTRTTRSMQLTPQGQSLLQAYRRALAEIDRALEQIESEQAQGTLRVETFSTFGMYWLLPRLTDFHQKHPGIRVYLNTEDAVRAPGGGDADVMIRFSDKAPVGFHSERLGTEEVFPVCSPMLLSRYQAVDPAMLLQKATLIATRNTDPNDCMSSWPEWARATGLSVSEDILYFNRTDLVLQAALAGQGIALGRTLMTRDAVASGTLVILETPRLKAPFTYHFVTPYERAAWVKIRLFHDWLLEQFRL